MHRKFICKWIQAKGKKDRKKKSQTKTKKDLKKSREIRNVSRYIETGIQQRTCFIQNRTQVNSTAVGNGKSEQLVTKSKGTWGGADKDLAAKVKGKSESVELQQIGELAETLSQVHNLTEKPYDDKDVKNVEKLEKKLEKMLKEVDKTMRGSGLSAPAFSMVRSGIVKGLESIKKFYKIANNIPMKESNIMDTYRQMWEDTIVEKKEMNPKIIDKIAKLTDRNDHNESLLLLAKELRDKDSQITR